MAIFLISVALIGVYIWMENDYYARKARQEEIERNKELEEWQRTHPVGWDD